MSWSASGTIPRGSTQAEAEKIIAAATVMGQDDLPEERDRAVKQAQSLVLDILHSGVLGDPEQHGWAFSINGHANPGNVKPPNWADDCISVNVRQMQE